MRAEEFAEDNFGTAPKRAARPGARPHRGHEPVPRYRSVEETDSEKIAGRYDPEEFDAMVQRVGQKARKNPMTGVSPIVQRMRDELAQADKDNVEVNEAACPHCGGPAFGDLMLAEKKDACYHKVRSRYKVWPSAYASGALVQCRKKGAKNWGNKSESIEEANPNQQISVWNPETKTYRGAKNKIPTSTSVDVDDITARGRQVDLPQHRELSRNVADVENPEDVVYKNDLKRLVQQHFKSLPNNIREVLTLRFWDGMTLDQAAERMGISRSMVANLEAKGLRLLKHSTRLGQLRESDNLEENLRKWFKEKWVRFGPDGKIRGDCARGSEGEGKPKCLPQQKAHALGKKGRASAAARKRRQDPNPERRGAAKNVATKKQ